MAATLAAAHFTAAQVGIQIVRDHRQATEEDDLRLAAFVAELRRIAVLNGWTETGGEAALTFVTQRTSGEARPGAGQWRLEVYLDDATVENVTLNGMVVGNDQAPNVLRTHGVHGRAAVVSDPGDNVVRWRPSPTQRVDP
jgi:hypothetical protein